MLIGQLQLILLHDVPEDAEHYSHRDFLMNYSSSAHMPGPDPK